MYNADSYVSQVANQRWLTVGAILVVGGAGLLAADAVSELQSKLALAYPVVPKCGSETQSCSMPRSVLWLQR